MSMSRISIEGHDKIKRVVNNAFEGQPSFAHHNLGLAPVVKGYASIVRALVSGVLGDQELSMIPIGSAVRGTALPGRTDLDFYLFSDPLRGYDDTALRSVSSRLQENYFNSIGAQIDTLRSMDVALAHRVSRLYADRVVAVDGLSYLEVFLGKNEPNSSVLVATHTQLQSMQAAVNEPAVRALRLKFVFDQLGIYGTNTNLVGRGLNGVATELLALRADLIEPNQVVEFVLELVNLILYTASDEKRKMTDGMLQLSLQSFVPDLLSVMPQDLKQVLAAYPIAADHATVLSRRLGSS